MTRTYRFFLSLLVSLLAAACATKPKVVYVEKPYPLPPEDYRKVRIPDYIHAYAIGRLPTKDGLAMDEAHEYYRIEQTAHWDQRLPSRPLSTTGPVTAFTAPTARKLPTSKELEAAEDRVKTLSDQLVKARETYLQAANGMQSHILDIAKSKALADSYRSLLQTEQENVKRLKEENARLRLAAPEESAMPASAGRPTVDPYERLKEWEKKEQSHEPPSSQ